MAPHRSVTPAGDEHLQRYWTRAHWAWHSTGHIVESHDSSGVATLEILGPVDEELRVTLVAPERWPMRPELNALSVRIRSTSRRLRVEIDPRQMCPAWVDLLEVDGEFDAVTVLCPIWTGDPEELGTVQIERLYVACHELILGGDHLDIGKLNRRYVPGPTDSLSEYEDDDAWRGLQIMEDSKVNIRVPLMTSLQLGDRSRLSLPFGGDIMLGRIGMDAELTGQTPVNISEWKVHLCEGNERIHLNRVLPLNYHLVRALSLRIRETSEDLLGSYSPVHPDILPTSLSQSAVATNDWINSHNELVSRYSSDPAVKADSRWLTYEAQRLLQPNSLTTRAVLSALRLLGYGLKPGPPLKLWVLSVIAVVLTFSLRVGIYPTADLSRSSVWTAIRLWVEAFLLPTGIASLSQGSANSVLNIEGTGLRLARIAVSVLFASFLFALRARIRLPQFSDSKL